MKCVWFEFDVVSLNGEQQFRPGRIRPQALVARESGEAFKADWCNSKSNGTTGAGVFGSHLKSGITVTLRITLWFAWSCEYCCRGGVSGVHVSTGTSGLLGDRYYGVYGRHLPAIRLECGVMLQSRQRRDRRYGHGNWSLCRVLLRECQTSPGSVSQGSGSFKIDHPLIPPTNTCFTVLSKALDMKNVYDGVVILDGTARQRSSSPSISKRSQRLSVSTHMHRCYAPVFVSEEIAGKNSELQEKYPGLSFVAGHGNSKRPIAVAHRLFLRSTRR